MYISNNISKVSTIIMVVIIMTICNRISSPPPRRHPRRRFFLRQMVPDSVLILCEKCAMDPAAATHSAIIWGEKILGGGEILLHY